MRRNEVLLFILHGRIEPLPDQIVIKFYFKNQKQRFYKASPLCKIAVF